MVAASRPPTDRTDETIPQPRSGGGRRTQGNSAAAERVIRALRRSGLAGEDEPVFVRDRVEGGPREWWLLRVSDTRTVWVQHLRDPRLQVGAARAVRSGRIDPRWEMPQHVGVHLAMPVAVAPASYAYLVSSGADILARVILRGLGIGGTPRGDWLWLPPLCARLGAALRAFHELSGGTHRRPALPRVTDVTRRVRELLGADSGSADASVREALEALPRLREALIAAVRRFRTEPEPVVLHGRLGSGEILIRLPRDGGSSPDVSVAGWLEAAAGPRAHDAGYFIGELMELATIAADTGNAEAERRLRAAVPAFYRAYVLAAQQPLPDGFAHQVAEFAALKIVEHVARFAQYGGRPGPAEERMLRLADGLLCLERGLARPLTG